LTRVAVILHERLGHWVRQLRPRLYDQPVRWFETRSSSDLEGILTGLAYPVVLVDLGRHAATGLKDLGLISLRAPDARILVLDPETHPQVPELARELGATHVVSGFAPPPVIAELIARWIALARRGIEYAGWSRTTFPETQTDPWSWLSDYLDEPEHHAETSIATPPGLRRGPSPAPPFGSPGIGPPAS